MKIVGDRILVKLIDEKQSDTDFVLSQTKTVPPQKAEIIATGPGKKDEPMVLCVGDIILYAKRAGTEIKINGELYVIMREGDAYCAL